MSNVIPLKSARKAKTLHYRLARTIREMGLLSTVVNSLVLLTLVISLVFLLYGLSSFL